MLMLKTLLISSIAATSMFAFGAATASTPASLIYLNPLQGAIANAPQNVTAKIDGTTVNLYNVNADNGYQKTANTSLTIKQDKSTVLTLDNKQLTTATTNVDVAFEPASHGCGGKTSVTSYSFTIKDSTGQPVNMLACVGTHK